MTLSRSLSDENDLLRSMLREIVPQLPRLPQRIKDWWDVEQAVMAREAKEDAERKAAKRDEIARQIAELQAELGDLE